MATNEDSETKISSDDNSSDDNSSDDGDDGSDDAIIKLNPDKEEEIAKGVFEHTFGIHGHQEELTPEKVLMVVGGSGIGKSTLINRMINHIFDVKYTDEFRYKMVIEKKKSQTESQTRNITKYTLLCSASNKKFNLIVIDTPGIGDTAGKGEDRNTIEKIKNLFASGTIKVIHAICFVENYNHTRLNEHVKYIFQTIAQIFGKDTEENIFIMATTCDEIYDGPENKIKQAPVLKCFKKAQIPNKKWFPFNNKDIYKTPMTKGTMLDREQNNWETSTISFNHFFQELDRTTPASLVLSAEILRKRHNIIHAQLPDFVRKLKSSIHLIDEHKENLKGIEKEINNPEEDFTFEATIEKEEWVDIKEPGIFCVRCQTCKKVCHDPCDIKKNKDLWWCDIMSWFNLKFRIYCTVCPKQCSWEDHVSLNQRLVRKTVTETRTSEDLKRKYMEESRNVLLMKIGVEMVNAYGKLLEDLHSIQECIDFINDNCLSKVPIALHKYIDDIIEEERQVKEDGYLKRITVLDNLMNTMKKINIYEAFKQGSSEEQLQQAKMCYD